MNSVRQQWLTLVLLIVFVLEIVAFDVWLARTRGVNATFSRVSLSLFEEYPILYPIICVAIGILIGHIGLPQYIRNP